MEQEKRKFFSHPNKELQDHLNGVREKSEKRGLVDDITGFCSLNHDMAKVNINFFKKLNGQPHGYANHGYLSAYIGIYLIIENKKIREKYKPIIESNKLFPCIVTNIIKNHHGNLKNIDEIFTKFEDGVNVVNVEELSNVENFINGNEQIDFDVFINLNYPEFKDETFFFKRKYIKEIFFGIAYNINYLSLWKEHPVKNFYDTTFNFGLLVEADKRDASGNSRYVLDDIDKYNRSFNNNLNRVLRKFKDDSEINKERTKIRKEAEENLIYQLRNTNNRVFELNTQTGSGKTLILARLAAIIQQEKKKNGSYGTIMSFPYTSITDQVTQIFEKVLKIDILNYTSISSNSQQLENFANLGENYSEEELKSLISYSFSEETFDHPFVVTTFVQFFQTLIGNKNSVLIKLPNFSKRIFLIDEFQAMPPNLYTFFNGILQYFCEKYDCYCIMSTATMPNFCLNDKKTNGLNFAKDIFKNYKIPSSLVDSKKYYLSDVFNRYIIHNIGDKNLEELSKEISKKAKDNSVLVMMNTVKTSVKVFNSIPHTNKFLLNKNFSTQDKLDIIKKVNDCLKNNEKVLLVTTQVVEAGVDIDFPVVFRDTCPLPSLIQAAGRCNRNGKLEFGEVYMFNYYEITENGYKQYSAEFIYDIYDLNFVKKEITTNSEKELFEIQKKYYKNISEYKCIGRVNGNLNLLDAMSEGKIETLGRYRMIENSDDEFMYFVGDEKLWKEFSEAYNNKPEMTSKDYSAIKKYNILLKIVHKKILKFCVNVKIGKKENVLQYTEEIIGIRNATDKSCYSHVFGMNNLRLKK